MATTMLPAPELLPDVLPTERLNARGMARPPVRDEYRRIPDVRNAVTVASALLQTAGVVIAAGWIGTWWSYLLAFLVMGRGHCQLNILGHEAAHKLLFTRRRLNDRVGRWLLAYPGLQGMLSYRRVHMAHHRDEMGPEEPDAGLYAGYPIPPDSLRRKLTRDLLGVSGSKNIRGLLHAARRPGAAFHEARLVVGVQLAMFAAACAWGRPLLYPVCWLLPWMSLWKVSNRLRSIAEHGGMERADDRRLTTHVVRQSRLARLLIVPYNTGWHLAHHVDIGVPFRHLPAFHEELVRSGWVVPELEYPSYPALWRRLASGAPRDRVRGGTRVEAGNGFLPC
ncbi:MAG TPA: fatty acid desaturase [Candidatus Dormibacteraeota bacterium]|nr:fatty acid desaturase [Candidatus Dormibacteraeota bacterium]